MCAAQFWEGTALPRDQNRPVVNIFHTRLIIAVDWFRGTGSSGRSGDVPARSKSIAPSANTAEIESVHGLYIFPVVLRRSLTPTDHASYTKYVAAVYEKQQQALSAAQPQSPASTARNASKDNRVGINIEQLLRWVSPGRWTRGTFGR